MREVIIGQKYHHFKNKDYIVIDIVNDAGSSDEQNLDKIVIYQALYGEKLKWARTLPDFLSPVDQIKYPNIKQKYRFEEINQ